MNTSNNKRYQDTEAGIHEVFIELLKSKSLDRITVAEVCRLAGINRSTFYTHYSDMPDLVKSTEKQISKKAADLFRESAVGSVFEGFVFILRYIRENSHVYAAYINSTDHMLAIRLILDSEYLDLFKEKKDNLDFESGRGSQYNYYFFASGLTAIIKLWLYHNCEESPEELAEMLIKEYRHIYRV